MDARGVTLSSGGMSLITLSNLPVGCQVDVEFMPPSSQEIVRVSGTVRSRALYLYGIEFLANSNQRQRSAATHASA